MSLTTTVIVSPAAVTVVSAGTQGPPGPPGATGPAGPAGAAGPPGATDHAALTHLDYASAGHTGFTPATRQVIAGVGLTGGGNLSADVTLSLPALIVAGVYGDTTHYPILTLDAEGRVTAVSLQGLSPGGVTTFNTRTGDIVLTSADVTSALGFSDFARLGLANTFTVGPQTVQIDASTNRGVVVKGAASQSVNLQEWQNSTGAVLSAIASTGQLLVPGGTRALPSLALGLTSVGFYSLGGGSVSFGAANIGALYIDTAQVILAGNNYLAWSISTTDASAGSDLRLYRDAAGTLSQRNGVNPQTLRVENTFTSASVREFLEVGWATNVCTVKTRALGTGVLRGLDIGGATTDLVGFYGATPIAQRSGAAQAAVATTAATSTAPFGYTTAAQADAIVTLLNELRAWAVSQGFIKGSA